MLPDDIVLAVPIETQLPLTSPPTPDGPADWRHLMVERGWGRSSTMVTTKLDR